MNEQDIRRIIKEEMSSYFKSDRMTMFTLLQILDGRNIQTGIGVGTKIGTATTQKIGFFNATPVVQQTDFGAQTDNTGGTADDTLDNVPTSSLAAAVAVIEDNEAGLAAAINDIRTRLRNLGLVA